MIYVSSGFVFDSPSMEFPEIRTASGLEPTCTFRIVESAQVSQGKIRWYNEWRRFDGVPCLRFGKTQKGFVLDFPATASFYVTADLSDITCTTTPATPPTTVRQLFSNQVLPLLISQTGKLVLHASGAALHGRGVAFAGPSGIGKSTLAAHLATRGAELLCDDCLVVESSSLEKGTVVRGNHNTVRLWPDTTHALSLSAPEGSHPTHKRVIPLSSSGQPLVKLAAVYLLARGERSMNGPGIIDRLSAGKAFASLVQFVFSLDLECVQTVTRGFHALCDLIETVPCYSLTIRPGFESLDLLADRIRGNSL